MSNALSIQPPSLQTAQNLTLNDLFVSTNGCLENKACMHTRPRVHTALKTKIDLVLLLRFIFLLGLIVLDEHTGRQKVMTIIVLQM